MQGCLWYLTRWGRMSKWQLIGATAFWVAVAICFYLIPDLYILGNSFLMLAAIFGSILAFKVIRDARIADQNRMEHAAPPQVMGPPRSSSASSNFTVPPRHPDDRS